MREHNCKYKTDNEDNVVQGLEGKTLLEKRKSHLLRANQVCLSAVLAGKRKHCTLHVGLYECIFAVPCEGMDPMSSTPSTLGDQKFSQELNRPDISVLLLPPPPGSVLNSGCRTTSGLMNYELSWGTLVMFPVFCMKQFQAFFKEGTNILS